MTKTKDLYEGSINGSQIIDIAVSESGQLDIQTNNGMHHLLDTSLEKHPGNWVRAEDDVYSKEDEDEPWKDFALWESDID